MVPRRAPPQLIDDVTAVILLRLPPDEPEHLFRAALVCKRWLRIICDPGFLRRRYRASHGAPPLLGLLHRLQVLDGPPPARVASTTSVPDFPHPGSDGPSTAATAASSSTRRRTTTWTTSSGAPSRATATPWKRRTSTGWSSPRVVLLCAAHGCDHLDCHGGGPFRVVFAATPELMDTILASVYSSEADEWSVPVCLDSGCESFVRHMERERLADKHHYTPYILPRRGAVVGDGVYFTLRRGNSIVNYDLGKNRLSIIDPPCRDVYEVALMAMEDTSLGSACLQGSSLYVWSRKVGTEESAEWVQYRVIELEEIIPVADHEKASIVVGSAEGVGVVFVSTDVGLFMINLNSGQPKKVDEPGVYFSVLPYMSFYTPATFFSTKETANLRITNIGHDRKFPKHGNVGCTRVVWIGHHRLTHSELLSPPAAAAPAGTSCRGSCLRWKSLRTVHSASLHRRMDGRSCLAGITHCSASRSIPSTAATDAGLRRTLGSMATTASPPRNFCSAHLVVARGSRPRRRSMGGRPVTSSTRRTPKE